MPTGKHLIAVPINMIKLVNTMANLRPLTSMNQSTGTTGMMYMMLPQLPNRASVALVQSGQNTANTDLETGPKLFHIMPWNQKVFAFIAFLEVIFQKSLITCKIPSTEKTAKMYHLLVYTFTCTCGSACGSSALDLRLTIGSVSSSIIVRPNFRFSVTWLCNLLLCSSDREKLVLFSNLIVSQ